MHLLYGIVAPFEDSVLDQESVLYIWSEYKYARSIPEWCLIPDQWPFMSSGVGSSSRVRGPSCSWLAGERATLPGSTAQAK